MTFNNEIEKIDTVRAYHVGFDLLVFLLSLTRAHPQSGPGYFVEVDVVMNASTPLWKAHDISQQLQDRIEVLPNVERAFVHVDHETDHVPVHIHLLKAIYTFSFFNGRFQEHRKGLLPTTP